MAASTTATTRAPKSRPRAKQGAGKRPVRPEDLTRYIVVSSPQISPDGRRIVFVRKHVGEKNEYVTNLWMARTDGSGEPTAFTSGGKDGHPRWSPGGSRIAFISRREKTRPQIYVMNADGGEATALTKFPEGSIGTFKWAPDGRSLAVSFRKQDPEWREEAKKEREKKGLSDPPRVIEGWWYRLDGDGYFNAQRYHLYLVDAETGEHRKVYDKDNLSLFSFDFSPDSKKLAITTNLDRKAMIRPWKTELLILDIRSGALRAVPGLPEGPKDAVAWSPDGSRLAYAGREDRDDLYSVENLQLWVWDAAKGEARCLTKKEDYCLMAITIGDVAEVAFDANLRWSPDSKRIFMKLGWHGEMHVASIRARGGTITFHTEGAAEYDMGNLSGDGRCMALTRMSATKLPEVFVGEIEGDAISTTPLTGFNKPVLKELAMAEITSHWVTSADGTKVQVWVMMPPGFKKGGRKKYPAVLEIHGGPHGQYGVGYFHEFQVLAAAGHVVFFSNPRGSKGYGRDHCAAIRGDWGSADWADLQAVIEFMQDHPHVDATRMGVMGGSYGGYMTNWIIGHTKVFAGAISDRCVSNLVSMAGNSDFIEAPDVYFPGNVWDRPETRWEQSPLKYLGNAKTPTLLIHSEGDLRCNIEQSEQVYAALRLLNVPTKFVRYPRSTSHGMSRGGPPDMRLHRLGQIVEWWGKWLGK